MLGCCADLKRNAFHSVLFIHPMPLYPPIGKTFEVYSGERGVWNKKVNEAYSQCFCVDLVKLGCMNIGSQLDAYTIVHPIEFDEHIVQQNFALLPRRKSPSRFKLPLSRDSTAAKVKQPPSRFKPTGGVKHYYVP